ncbi:Calx-beta domain-containing protein [Vibrio natriegens]|uniref:Calx-beta domain-containing protein n=1 Tax=Vibrio natriegens TaxID=691 RepID=UPI001FBA2F85|nr:Calx-beta domain-containing protein [Vibrio natriegens]
MDRVTLSSLMGNIVVIGLDGNIRTLAKGESPKPGELIIEEVSDTSELVVEQVTPQGSSINVTDDITALIEAIGQGQDPTQLGEDFETAAGGVNGSSPQTTGAINRTGTEVLASTNFETVGINGTGFSSTQVQTLLDIFQPQAPAPQVTPLPAEVVVQEISSPTVNEGDQVVFDVTLDQATEAITDIEMTLGDGSAVGGSAGEEGTDYVNTTVIVTLSDGTTQEIQVNEDGTFTVSLPIGEQSFTVSLDTVDDDIYEGPETFTLTGTTADQTTPVSGTATVLDDGTGPGTDPDDDRPSVSISDAGIVDEGDIASFTVSLSNASEDAVQVQLTLNPGETEADDLGTLEYNTGSGWVSVPVDGVVSVPAGMTEFEVRIASTQDEVYEGAEDFSVTVTGVDVVQGSDTGLATIVDDGSGPEPDPDDDRPSVSISDAGIVDEGDIASFTVSLSNASEAAVQVQLTLNPGETEAGDLGTFEYNTGSGWVSVPVDGMVTVPAGMTEFDVRVASTQDEVYEGAEDFSVTVTGIDVVQGSDTGLATIVDDGSGPEPDPDDDRPSVSISDAGIVDEGDIASFTVSLSNASEAAVQVQLTLNPGETEAGDLGALEYNTGSGWVSVPVDGMVTVPAGMTEFDVRVASTQDEVYEGAEDFSVTVTGIDVVQGSDTGLATIVDDGSGPEPDPDDDRPSVSISDAGIVDEGDIASFTVSLSNASEAAVQVQLTLNPGETEAGDLGTLEYNTGSGWVTVPVDGTVTVPAGMTEFDVRVASVQDEVYEGAEDFSVTVTGIGAVQGSDTGLATIVDDGSGPEPDPDDDRPSVSISDAGTIDEGSTATFTVTLSNASEDAVQVQLALNPDQTEVGDLGILEYNTGSGWVEVPVGGLVTVPAGMTEFDVRIGTTSDDVYEGPEDFSVTVTGIGVVQGQDTGTATIVDDGSLIDDDRPTVSIVGGGLVDEGNTAEFTVKLSNESDVDVQVELQLNHVDTEDADFLGDLEYLDVFDNSWKAVPPDGVVTIYANQTDLALRIQTDPDEPNAVYEGPEEFNVSVEGLGPVQGTDSASATIVDDGTLIDDDRPTVSIVGGGLVDEGNTAEFTVKLSNESDVDVQVELQLNHVDTEDADFSGDLEYLDVLDNSWKAVPPDGVVTIYANQTDLALRIQTDPDEPNAVYEGPEEFNVSVEGLGPVQGTDSASATIVDDGTLTDDDRPTVSIVGGGLVDEGNTAEFTVKLSNESDVDVQVELQLNHVDTEDADFLGDLEYLDVLDNSWKTVPPDGVVTIYANQTDLALRIQTDPDEPNAVYEGPEEFNVSVEGLGPVQGTDSASATIVDDGTLIDDDRPTVSIVGGGLVDEGNIAEFTVKLSNESDVDVQVELQLNHVDTEDADFLGDLEYLDVLDNSWKTVPPDGVVTIYANQTDLALRIQTDPDEPNAVYEGPEAFNVSVEGLGPVQGTDSASATIVDDGTLIDDDRPTVAIVGGGLVDEGNTAEFTVKLSNESDVDVQVELQLNHVDTEDADFLGDLEYLDVLDNSWKAVPPDGVVTIYANQTDLALRIQTDPDEPNAVYEGPEAFNVSVEGLGPVQGADSASATIVDDGTLIDDDRPTVSIVGGGLVDEGNTAEFTVKLSNESDVDVQVELQLNHVDTEDADFLGDLEYLDVLDNSWKAVPPDGVVTIYANQTDLALRIQTDPDEPNAVYEGPEAFNVSVEGLGPVQGTDSASATIVDDGTLIDDDRPTVSIVGGGLVDEGNTAEFTVKLSNESDVDVQVELQLNHVDTEDADFLGDLEYLDVLDNSWKAVPPDGVVTIYANQTDLALRIQTDPDEPNAVYEGPEAFNVSVEGLGPVQGTDSASATIVDDGTLIDDDRPTVSIVGGGLVDEGNIAEFTVKLSNESDVDVQVELQLNHVDTEDADFLGDLEYLDVLDNSWKAVPPDGVVTIYANQTDLALRIQTDPDEPNAVYEGPEAFNVSVEGLGPVQGTDSASATIVDNSPPTARDFIISLNVEEGMFPVQDVDFDGLTSANEQRVEDLEDDANGANDGDLEIVITSLPEHGELYYLDNGVEVIIDQDFLNDPNNKLYENTDIKYRLTDDFFDEQSFDSADLLEDQGKDILVGSYTPPNSNLTFTGGQIITIGNSIIFDSDAQISVDFANQQVGLVVISPSETGQGDEISTGEYITLELDEDLSANEAKLNLASLNDRFNSGAAWLTAYIFLNGALVDVQQFYSTDITYTSNHEGFITVDMANGSFDEIRLTPETNSSSDKAGFTLVGTEITSFTDVNDDFTYQAIDTDGALSNEATVSVDFNNVTAESVATADYNTQSLTLTAAADAESNVIMGDEQDNELIGTSGNDILIGGLGDDILTGGEGDDVFKWTEMKSATDTVTDFETGDQLDFADLFEDVSQSDISLLLDDLGSGDYSGQVDDISITVTERGPNSTLMIHKGGMDLEVNFDGASAADIANSLISNLEHLRE